MIMKKAVIAIPFIAIVALIIFMSSSCKKEESIEAIITVKYLSDTTDVVPNAHVRIEKYDVNVEGVCNEKGVFTHTFRDEAILDVRAWEVDGNGDETMYGETSIRLEKGEVTRKSVYIN
jgi:hypothetical protein